MNHEESVLYAHLTEPDSLDVLAREGFLSESIREVIPTELGRTLVEWSLRQYFESGRKVAPTKEAILSTWGEQLEKVEITIQDDTETDSIQWAIEELRSKYATWISQKFVKEFAQEITKALATDKVSVIRENAGKLHSITQVLTGTRNESTADIGLQESLDRMLIRANQDNTLTGLTFGMPMVDLHTMGIHDGELAVFAAFTGVGKSWFATLCALAEWDRGRRTILYTLENDLKMTFDRMACIRARIPYDRWQQGRVEPQEVKLIQERIEEIRESAHAPVVVMPGRGDRTAIAMIRKAFAQECESIILDQLSFVERVPGSRARERREIFAENIQEIKSLISEGQETIPALVLAQIKREGQVNARKAGRYVVDDLAESSEIDRTADFVFSVFQSEADVQSQLALFQTLKARRRPVKDWKVSWRLESGDIRVLYEEVRPG